MKRWLVLLLAAAMLFSLAACGESGDSNATAATAAPDAVLTAGGVSITLPAGYSVVNDTSGREDLAAAFTNEDGTVAIYVIRESLAALGDGADYSAKEYLQRVHDASAAEDLSDVSEQDGLPYFTYTEKKDANALKNLCVGYRSGDNCYVVQFLCYDEHYDKYFRDQFFRWAGTVAFA